MTKFGLDLFLKKSNLLDKHVEIFDTDRKSIAEKFLEKFRSYTRELNEINDIDKFVELLKHEYGKHDQVIDKLEPAEWNEEYFNFETSNKTKAKLNDLYVFPHNTEGHKLRLDYKFYVNCIRLIDADPNSIKLVNRNGHMMLAGETSNNNKELGTGITFKILMLYNHKNKQWIVSPFKMVSQTEHGVDCSAFSKSATNNDVKYQFYTWKNGLENIGKDIGVVNYKYLDKKYRNLKNLFTPEQSNQLLIKAKQINREFGTGGSAKKLFSPRIKKKKSAKSAKKSTNKKKKSAKKSTKKLFPPGVKKKK